ncbi:fibronectin type III domain-containing protein [Rhodococcus sp. ZPP]|uniref:sialate O-acetylesterase n=1 Tax=Rhodococcus sp. ZPP TaxID=2749906 RepID=UPI001AD89C29|nr:sialate O-acetylesterase [Rhodococcus sp. ZPP]QTJ65864.1 fibronectin type III domain-containing protein [Rhodococcus sp. ZPP]
MTTIADKFTDGTGAGDKATLKFWPPDLRDNAASNAMVTKKVITVPVAADGTFSVVLDPGHWQGKLKSSLQHGTLADEFDIIVPDSVDDERLFPLIETYTPAPAPVVNEARQWAEAAEASAATAEGLSTAQDEAIAAKLADPDSETRTTANSIYAPVDLAVNPHDVGYDVWAVLGQSNTGSGVGLDVTYIDTTDGRIDQYANSSSSTYFGKIVKGVDPLMHQGGLGGVGFAMTFAKNYLGAVPPNRRVLLVPCGRGSTGFAPSGGFTWDPADTTTSVNLFNLAVQQISSALAAAGPNARLVGVLWHQGENDSGDTTVANAYAGHFDTLIDTIRTLFGKPDLPFILGQMTPDRMAEHVAALGSASGYPIVNAAHIDTPRRKARTAFAYGPAGYYNAENEKIHYNAAGQRILGRRYFDAYLLALGNVLGTDPVSPGAVTVTQTSPTAASISWVRTPGRVTDYLVEYKVGAGAWTTLTRAQSIDNTATLTGLPGVSTVQVRVSSINEQGTSSPSPVGSVTLVALPAQVTGLTAGTATPSSQPLSWSAVSGAASYKVEYKPNGTTTWLTAATVTGVSHTVTGLSAAAPYDYRVSAINAAGTGTPSTALANVSTAPPVALLTDVGVSAFTAYGTRKLSSSYSGSALKVRRSSDNTTQDIGFTAGGDLDTTALLAFAGSDSAYVDTLYDQSGNARNLVQATAANQPVLVESGVVVTKNGKPGIKFVGSAQNTLQGAFAGLYAAGAASVLGVDTIASTAASMAAYSEGGSAAGKNARYTTLWWSGAGAPVLNITDDTDVTMKQVVGTALTQNGTLHQVSTVDTGTQISLYANGALSGTQQTYTRAGTLTIARTCMGGIVYSNGVTAIAPFTGIVSEVVSFTSALTDTQRQAGQANQKGYFVTP